MKVEKDQLLAVTQGAYSDYCLKDHFRALQGFDTDEVAKQFKGSTKPTTGFGAWEAYDQDVYLAWCVNQGLIEKLEPDEVLEWYIGAYGDLA